MDHAEGEVAEVTDALHARIEHAVVGGYDAYRVPRRVAAHVELERLDVEPLGEAGDVLRLFEPAHDEMERGVDERPLRRQFHPPLDVLVSHAVRAEVLQEGGDASGSCALRLCDDVLLVGSPPPEVNVRVEHAREHVLSAAVDYLLCRGEVGLGGDRGNPAVFDRHTGIEHAPRGDEPAILQYKVCHGVPPFTRTCARIAVPALRPALPTGGVGARSPRTA